MGKNLVTVMDHVNAYFKEHLPNYRVLKVRRKSNHLEDGHLFMVAAKGKDAFAVWTCWNESTQSLNHGHYGLQSEADCERVMDEYYYRA